MKIEMGESLVYSWLRHVKKCQIVQNNWKVSSNWTQVNESRVNDFIEEARSKFVDIVDRPLFPGSGVPQIIQQAECDALGISRDENDGSYKIWGVDIAFHSRNGLGYGNYKENTATVIEKCVRTAMCLCNYMNVSSGEIVFVSPRINPGNIEMLDLSFQRLNQLFAEKNFSFKASYYYGDSFLTQVLSPTLNMVERVNDEAELFLRSMKMLSMFGLMNDVEENDDAAATPVARHQNSRRATSPRKVYRFNGNVYKMARLALEVVKNYVGDHPDVNYEQLKNVFNLVLSFDRKNMIRLKSELTDSELRHNRTFTDVDDMIQVRDANDVCVSKQWQGSDMPGFIALAERLGYEITEV